VRFKHLIIDDFLTPEAHAALLAFTLANEAAFVPAQVHEHGSGLVASDMRSSMRFGGQLGAIGENFRAAILSRQEALFAGTGTAPFAIKRCEIELAAHGHGGFFKLHQDTLTGEERLSRGADRLISTVYYFHAVPRRFSGGELALYPLGPGEPVQIEPRDNCLIAFASMAPHEVRAISSPGGVFAASRFSINCWLHRARDQ
jgi:SM-20-related protein